MTMKRHTSRLGMLALAGLLALSVTQSVKANLIKNGGFETGDFTDWTPSGNSGFTGVIGNFFGTPPHSGKFQAFFGPINSHGFISQSLATTAGASYHISFALANLGSGPNYFDVLWDGASILEFGPMIDVQPFDYGVMTFDVPASSASTQLQFEFMHNSFDFLLDDVRVDRVNAPDTGSTVSLFGLASLGIAALRRKLSRSA
jgi:protein with PEP-CTERM/exosortase system signal